MNEWLNHYELYQMMTKEHPIPIAIRYKITEYMGTPDLCHVEHLKHNTKIASEEVAWAHVSQCYEIVLLHVIEVMTFIRNYSTNGTALNQT